jgi:hypothetical protein
MALARYDQPVGGSGAVNGSTSPVLWVALAEKAYVEANAAGVVFYAPHLRTGRHSRYAASARARRTWRLWPTGCRRVA